MASAKEIVGLDFNADYLSGIERVLQSRFEEMCDFYSAALDFSDIEGVHDMRVASRRLRSALKMFSPFIKKRPLKKVRKEIKEIADALGEVRDRDVAIRTLEKMKDKAEREEIKEGIEKITESHNIVREQARIALSETLSVERLTHLKEMFNQSLNKAIENERESLKEENQDTKIKSLRTIGSEIIMSDLKKFLALGQKNIYDPFDVDALHKLRIMAKQLRYAVETFADCRNDESILSFAKMIAGIQSSLGEIHDRDIWIKDLNKCLRHAENQAEHESTLWLLSRFVKGRTKHYCMALEHWRDWREHNSTKVFLKES